MILGCPRTLCMLTYPTLYTIQIVECMPVLRLGCLFFLSVLSIRFFCLNETIHSSSVLFQKTIVVWSHTPCTFFCFNEVQIIENVHFFSLIIIINNNDDVMINDTFFCENRCVSHVPNAVGAEPAHFDLLLARSAMAKGTYLSNDWLVLKLQELVSLSYQV